MDSWNYTECSSVLLPTCPTFSVDNFPAHFIRGALDEDDLNESQLGLPHVKALN